MNETGFDLDGIVAMITDMIAAWGLKVLGAIVVFIIGRMVAKWARRAMGRVLKKGNMDETLVPFLTGMTYYLLMAFVVVAVLGMMGIQTASMIAVLGAAGLAVGLALQGTLGNFASGVMLLVFRPFRVGDFIEAAGIAGSVESISIFTTRLNTPDNVGIVIPNSAVWGSTIKNYAANDTRRIDLVAGISYDDDIGLAIRTIEQMLQDPRVLKDPAPTIAVSELADSSVNIVVRPWCNRNDYWGLRFDLTRKMKEDLESAGCTIPFPQRDVHMHEVKPTAA
ncbi:MAG: mechanosensitive ion channel [Gemmatimonadales bacterium]|jgi:small conductance mechanosensitive channel